MKIIHVADLHVDSKVEYLQSEKSKIMREEQISVFEDMIEYAKANGVSVIIMAGDTFDKGNVAKSTKERILFDIKTNSEIDFLYLTGNHDEDVIFESVEIPKNLKFFKDEWTAFEYGNVCIAGVELTKSNAPFVYDALKLDEKKINVVTLHGQVVGYKTKKDGEDISLPKLKNKNIDYLALGHIHTFAEDRLDLRGKYCYSGCLKGRGFDELGDKGFVMLTVSDNKIDSEFIPFSKRNFYEHSFDVSSYPDFFSAMNETVKELQERYASSSLIKLVLVGTHKENFVVDTIALAERCKDKFFFVKVIDKTLLKISDADYQNEKSVKGEFIRKVLSDESLSDEDKNKIILLGLKALKGDGV